MADWRCDRNTRLSELAKIFESGHWPFSKRSLRLTGEWPPRRQVQSSPLDLFWGAVMALSSFNGVKVKACLPRGKRGNPEERFQLELELFGVPLKADLMVCQERPNHRGPRLVIWLPLNEGGRPRELARTILCQLVHSLSGPVVKRILAGLED